MAPKTPPSGRTSIKGVSKMPRQFVRTAVDNVKKAHIIKFYRSHGMVATVDKFYPGLGQVQKKTTKRQIYKCVEKEESIMDAVASGNGHLKKTRSAGLSAVLSEEDEDQIAHWVRDLRHEGVPVSPFMLTCKAQEVAEDAGLPVGLFSASNSWKRRFLKKYRLSLRRKTRIGQITPADSAQVAQKFRLDVLKTIEEEGEEVERGRG